jgi:hypothetical protein
VTGLLKVYDDDIAVAVGDVLAIIFFFYLSNIYIYIFEF